MSRKLLVAGIPASGKTTFGKYLEKSCGFVHLDVEKPGVLDRWRLGDAWGKCFQLGNSRAFVEALDELKRDVVVDWGFPPRWLPVVASMISCGMEGWWFDGDVEAARELFVKRATVDTAALSVQLAAIRGARSGIEACFAGHILATVSKGPRVRDSESIAKEMGLVRNGTTNGQ